jgi:hypothetical protein
VQQPRDLPRHRAGDGAGGVDESDAAISYRLTKLKIGLPNLSLEIRSAMAILANPEWRPMARSSPQSAQRYPLTAILGTEANVRLLRELFRNGGQMSAPLLEGRTGLAKASVWAALAALEGTGIVACAGTGRTHLYSIRADHPLSGCLDALFEAEEARFAAIRDAVRSAAAANGPVVIAV